MGVEVCPLRKPEVKSFQLFSLHVDAMLCDPQPKGIKRRYPEEDDDSDPPGANSYNQQRQEIFQISYEKLCRFRQSPDSSLLRYVLIFNTMRNVEQEMERDGIKVNSAGPFLPPGNCEVSTLDPPPNIIEPYATGHPLPEPPYAAAATLDYDRCVMDLDNSTSGRATPFVRTPPSERAEPGALWNEDRLTSLNWSSVFSSTVTTSCSSARSTLANGHRESEEAATSLHTLMPPASASLSNLSITYSSSSSTSPSTSPTSSSEDEIFGDIDLALYDFDLLSPLSPPNVRMAPVSAEELLRSLSNATAGDPCAATATSYYKSEHFTEEHVATSVRS